MIFKSKAAIIMTAIIMSVSMAGCGNNDAAANVETQSESVSDSSSADESLSKSEYIEKAEKINTISTDIASAMVSWQTSVQNGDKDAALESISQMRELVNEYDDFISIKNPPEEAKEVHEKLVSGVSGIKSFMLSTFDLMTKISNGEALTEDDTAKLNESVQKLQTEMTDLTQALEEFEALK